MTWITGVLFRISHLHVYHVCPYRLRRPFSNRFIRGESCRGMLEFKGAWSKNQQILWNGLMCWKSEQLEYINHSGVFGTGSKANHREDGWKCLAYIHTGFGWRTFIEKKKTKVFIGWASTAFLYNVIITQAGHIYCLYMQHSGVTASYYLLIFSQLKTWCKQELL